MTFVRYFPVDLIPKYTPMSMWASRQCAAVIIHLIRANRFFVRNTAYQLQLQ